MEEAPFITTKVASCVQVGTLYPSNVPVLDTFSLDHMYSLKPIVDKPVSSLTIPSRTEFIYAA